MKTIVQKISILLNILKKNWYYIPHFKWINDIEIWLILWELWSDVYQMNSREFIWFVWWYPENFTSWWGHMVKPSRLSNKKWIIKKFVYVWMYWFQLHNPTFRLYKKLLTLYYGISEDNYSVISMKNKRKVEVKCWEKLLKIIHDWYRNQSSFSEQRFIQNTIIPTIKRMKEAWINNDAIKNVIKEVFKNKVPKWIKV
jgi:hypothetical protein